MKFFGVIGLFVSLMVSALADQTNFWVCNFTNENWLNSWDLKDGPVGKTTLLKGSSNNITRIDDVNAPGGAYLHIFYPAGSYSTDDPAVGGTQFYGAVLHTNGNVPSQALTLVYWIRFPTNFIWVNGGKLPGLYGGTGNTGTNLPDGTDGFTTRFMWRTNGAGEAFPFPTNSATKYGTSLGRGNWYFDADGRWHKLQQDLILNDVTSSNGIIRVFYDDVCVLNTNGLYFRKTNTLKIDGVLFQTFFGGGSTNDATPVDTYVDFAAFSVTNYLPSLSIKLLSNDLVISWSANVPYGFLLESAAQFSPTSTWSVVLDPAIITNVHQAVIPITGETPKYYRLRDSDFPP